MSTPELTLRWAEKSALTDPGRATAPLGNPMDLAQVLDRLARLPEDWHAAGLLSVSALRAVARNAPGLITHSAETGAGRSTLLFSHLSDHHLVFAVNDGESVTRVKESELLRAAAVQFVLGPTQRTLPGFEFEAQLDIVLLDGPHGYPFPDLEYFYLYPRIREGGLLVIDDIHIPTIRNLFRFVSEDDMFDLIQVVHGRTALFRRTAAPTFDPYGDGWWLQHFNASHLPRSARLRALLPAPVRRRLKTLTGRQ